METEHEAVLYSQNLVLYCYDCGAPLSVTELNVRASET